MKVGTLPWLLRHELRLWWREMRSKTLLIALAVAFGLLIAMLFTLSWFALSPVRQQFSFDSIPEPAVWATVMIWLVGFFYAFIQAMGQSIVALFDRGDLDLLIASPISSKVVFASRLLGVAVETFLGFCLLVVPISLIAILVGVPQLLGLYPALIGISLYATSLSMLLSLLLVRLFGAKRARAFAQILTVFFSAIVFLGIQLPNLVSQDSINGISGASGAFWPQVQYWFRTGSLLGADSLVWFPAKTIFFDPIATLLTLLTSSLLAWLTVETLHRSFVAGTQQSMTRKQRQLRPGQSTRFASGFNRVVLLKEWRIIRRNPYLISNIFLQILFLIPALVIVSRGNMGVAIASFSTFVATVSTFVGSTLAQSLTQICVSGEEAADLLKASPVNSATLRRLKLLSALIPVWLLLSPLFITLIVKGEAWLPPLLVFLCATTSAAILRLWNSRPISLSDLFKRRQNVQGDALLGFLELVSTFAWAGLGFGLEKTHSGWIFTPLGIVLMVMTIAYGRSRQLGTSLGF
jgi:ABC-2 type transport system permease protein